MDAAGQQEKKGPVYNVYRSFLLGRAL